MSRLKTMITGGGSMLGGYRSAEGSQDWARAEAEIAKPAPVRQWSREDIDNLNRINRQFGTDAGVFIS